MRDRVNIIGGGLAGCEAAYQLSKRGVSVRLFDMKPAKKTDAHVSNDLCELVCSNSLRSDRLSNAVGLLKEEMRLLGSLIMKAADSSRVEAGGALAVDRLKFARFVTDILESDPNIEIISEEVTSFEKFGYEKVIVATGPLTSDALFEKEGLSVPTTYQELVDVCNAFREKGYDSPLMGFTKEETTSLFTLTAYPFFCETVADDAEAVKNLNSLDASAGKYMRPTLEKMEQFLKDGCADLDACSKIEDNYEGVILRFFEGDVPMMTCSGDTVSGTKKRESRSEAFIANPFAYTFVPVPMSDDGANFLDMPNLQFSVNKDSQNLDMANEFMRFLVTSKELNKMAQNKGLMSPTKDLSFNSVYAAFGDVPEAKILSPEVIGLTDDAVIQLRQAVYGVCTGAMTTDEAIAKYGSFTN